MYTENKKMQFKRGMAPNSNEKGDFSIANKTVYLFKKMTMAINKQWSSRNDNTVGCIWKDQEFLITNSN